MKHRYNGSAHAGTQQEVAAARFLLRSGGAQRWPLGFMLHIVTVWLGVSFWLAGVANAAPVCGVSASGSPSYAIAIQSITRLAEFRAWSTTHSLPVTFGESMDKEILMNGSCYWSVSVYAVRPERLEMWQIFLIQHPDRVAFVYDATTGEPISLARWRRQRRIGASIQ